MRAGNFVNCSLRTFVLATLFCLEATAVSYDDFPTDLQDILDERITELNANGGICIAGKVIMSDGTPINNGEDVQVNLYHGWDEPLWVYQGGWFIMGRTGSSYYSGPGIGFILRAFGYDPIDASITVLDGEMTYLEFEMMKTPSGNLASVTGTVTDENDQPFNGASVSIRFPFANHGYRSDVGYTYPFMNMTTGTNGEYSFADLSICEHRVTATGSDYAYHTDNFTPPVGGAAVEDRKLYPDRRIIIDYVYQADGSHSFTSGDLQAGTIDWLNGEGGLDFSEGQVRCCGLGKDLNMRQDQDVLKFRNSYGCGTDNGFYDAGVVDFDSVTEAAQTGYSGSERLCSVGHVYVVRTCDEGHCAKFIVMSDECSFRTVAPGDPDPIEFAGYDFTIDFTTCSDFGRVYMRKFYNIPPELDRVGLPYYWEIAGLEGVTFSADLIINYDPTDVASAGLPEENLEIYRSSDDGVTWNKLDTAKDLQNKILQVEGIDSFSWFAIGVEHSLAGDLDKNGIVDLIDLSILSLNWLTTEPWYEP